MLRRAGAETDGKGPIEETQTLKLYSRTILYFRFLLDKLRSAASAFIGKQEQNRLCCTKAHKIPGCKSPLGAGRGS